jgi:hypothetical protein
MAMPSPDPASTSAQVHPSSFRIARSSHASMAPRMRSALTKSLSRSLDSNSVFYCPSCAIWRRTLSTRASGRSIDKTDTLRRSSRPQNTITASTPRSFNTSSVITAKSVPPRFKELYTALEGVKDAALEQVNLSRLQFALRGLESETPLIRVAGKFLLVYSLVLLDIGCFLKKRGTDLSLKCSPRIE